MLYTFKFPHVEEFRFHNPKEILNDRVVVTISFFETYFEQPFLILKLDDIYSFDNACLGMHE